ncbi:MAG TPA: 6-hydroxycyclohex-1-ene-1-carbonyl-CoA dehydrogenase [Planctomycetes bacterium]|nr:6-hydroxycyclohex-1-ene-1-carbonyl-CoA dehydrogenase [Planctomycetota bacterium]
MGRRRMVDIHGYEMVGGREPLRPTKRLGVEPGPEEVVVRVAGCGICHTDLGFLDDGVPTRHPLPLILGHEISGTVVATGTEAGEWLNTQVVVPAVIPCGACDACEEGRGSICRHQIFPGNDIDGGFADHVVVPALGLCRVPDLDGTDVDLASLSVLADAVTTPYQSILRSGLGEGDFAAFIGVGGVGAFGVQIARALGATVAAIDVDTERLARIQEYGAALTIDAKEKSPRDVKKILRAFVKEKGLPQRCWRIFETSGHPAGQETAFGLLVPGAYLGIVGFTPKKVTVPVSHLMAHDATAQGNWGCLPEHYPAALDLVLKGRVAIEPFVTRRPLDQVNEALDDLRQHRIKERVVLEPAIS